MKGENKFLDNLIVEVLTLKVKIPQLTTSVLGATQIEHKFVR
jgi:hypothetical protein